MALLYDEDEFIAEENEGARDLAADMGYADDGTGVPQGIAGGIGGGVMTAGAMTGAQPQEEQDPGVAKPHILLFGLKRSGKSSILKVVFNRMSPHETRHLESTKSIEKSNVSNASFIKFEVWDFPGQLDWDPSFDDGAIFGPCGALIWVCDAQEDYNESLRRFLQTVVRAHTINPNIMFEFFIHKADGLSDDHKVECQRYIIGCCHDSLHEAGLSGVQITTHLTSIYDHSVFDAFSKVIQRMTPQLITLGMLLDSFTTTSNIDRAFLADIATKIYLVSDQSHVDMLNYDLCSDMIDVVTDILSIYKPQPDAVEEDPGIESTIVLTDGMVLYLRTVNRYLVLVCLIKSASFEKRGIIDYNFECLRKALTDVLELQGQAPGVTGAIPAGGAVGSAQGSQSPEIVAPIPTR